MSTPEFSVENQNKCQYSEGRKELPVSGDINEFLCNEQMTKI